MNRTDRREQKRITRAVRRGEAMSNEVDASIAVERAAEELRSLSRARLGYAAAALLAAAGVVVGIVGPREFLLPSAVLLEFIVVAHLFYLPRLGRNLRRAQDLNRAVATGSRDAR